MALLFNWTHSKSIDNVGENSAMNNAYCFSCDRSLSYLDTPDVVNLSGHYELPFGVGKKEVEPRSGRHDPRQLGCRGNLFAFERLSSGCFVTGQL